MFVCVLVLFQSQRLKSQKHHKFPYNLADQEISGAGLLGITPKQRFWQVVPSKFEL
jgi:hypothetical protein